MVIEINAPRLSPTKQHIPSVPITRTPPSLPSSPFITNPATPATPDNRPPTPPPHQTLSLMPRSRRHNKSRPAAAAAAAATTHIHSLQGPSTNSTTFSNQNQLPQPPLTKRTNNSQAQNSRDPPYASSPSEVGIDPPPSSTNLYWYHAIAGGEHTYVCPHCAAWTAQGTGDTGISRMLRHLADGHGLYDEGTQIVRGVDKDLKELLQRVNEEKEADIQRLQQTLQDSEGEARRLEMEVERFRRLLQKEKQKTRDGVEKNSRTGQGYRDFVTESLEGVIDKEQGGQKLDGLDKGRNKIGEEYDDDVQENTTESYGIDGKTLVGDLRNSKQVDEKKKQEKKEKQDHVIVDEALHERISTLNINDHEESEPVPRV